MLQPERVLWLVVHPIKEQQAMESVPVFVGLDYHSRSVQVCVVDAGGRVLLNRRCESAVGEVVGVIEELGSVRQVAIESCCGAAAFAEDLAAATGWRVTLAHPGYVNRMKNSPDKTDYGDARMLAELSRVGFLPEVWLAPPSIRELRAMVRYRAGEVERRKAIKLRILSMLRMVRIAEPPIGRWSKSWLAWLKDEAPLSEACRWIIDEHLAELEHVDARVDRAEARLAEMTAGDRVVQRLLTYKGIGLITACVLRAFIGRFDRFRTGKQLARFCAVTPRNASSGERVADAGMVKAGDPLLKTMIIQVAQRVRRHTPRWSSLGARLEAKGKKKCVVVGAIANRWVRWLHHEMLKEEAMA